ncbi:hypothetical protein [Kibdelosporangium aridum]|uniref:hypothetical protein n=1 Tax=Kibdelosporangium aridum TaxID=2030 RepID=UPI000691C2BF|nr:hypothetical protein [Kibdelosporangium aridum]
MTGWDLDALAASLRRGSDDLSSYAGFMIATLSEALPAEMVHVERKPGLFGRTKHDAPVLGLAIQLSDHRFSLQRKAVGEPVTARVAITSGGVVLRTNSVGMDVWCHELAAALSVQATANEAAAEVLRRLTVPP